MHHRKDSAGEGSVTLRAVEGTDCGISLLGDIKGATLDCGRAKHASQGPVLKAPLGWAGCLGPCGRGLVTPGSRKPLEGLG